MIDNFEKIYKLLEFDSEDDFYFLQLLQRKKENPQLGSNSRVIRNYYVGSEDYLKNRRKEIIAICEATNARASIRLNKRSYRKVAFKALEKMAGVMANDAYKFAPKSYDRAVGQGHNANVARWILDIDDKGRKANEVILFAERECKPDGPKFVTIIPSKNGYHLIMTPFDVHKFSYEFPEIEIHKDNPTNLYIP